MKHNRALVGLNWKQNSSFNAFNPFIEIQYGVDFRATCGDWKCSIYALPYLFHVRFPCLFSFFDSCLCFVLFLLYSSPLFGSKLPPHADVIVVNVAGSLRAYFVDLLDPR